MIYIYDDRAVRREENQKKLADFEDLIRFEVVKIVPGKSVEECIINSIENPECIMFHKSYVFEDNEVTFETIRHMFISFNVPIVIFSGGTEGCNKGNPEIDINADLMYENLPCFLENFRKEKHINIDVLLWGKRYGLNAILEFQNKLAEKFFINHDLDEKMELDEISKMDIQMACNKFNKELGYSIISDIETMSEKSRLTWLELRDIIDNNIKKN